LLPYIEEALKIEKERKISKFFLVGVEVTSDKKVVVGDR
jgi:hypothetical protein